jgi:hypothetical protein
MPTNASGSLVLDIAWGGGRDQHADVIASRPLGRQPG